MKKTFAVFGLGQFGMAIVEELARHDADVMAIDIDEEKVKKAASFIPTVFIADATDENASDCADLFRKALEQFFREFFGGKKSLENYKSEYGNLMKNHGIPAELSNSFEKVLNQYTTYMNSYAKHGNGTSKIALEYIMYQTGSLIRFLITLKQ